MSEQQAEERFIFTGEALAFDLVNTEVVVRRKPDDLLMTPNDLEMWWQNALVVHGMSVPQPIEIDDAVLTKVKALRAALRRIFTAIVEERSITPDDLEILNDVLHTGHVRLNTTPDGLFVANRYTDEGNALLLAVAQSAVWLLTECERARLRKCKNEHCVLMFYDTTKNGSRIWHSIDCMNRARSAERYRQQKSAQ